MREIVDKHFPDNWVISMYLGYTVDLSSKFLFFGQQKSLKIENVVAWDGYKAAKAALANTTQIPHVTKLKENYWSKVDVVLKKLDQFLTEVRRFTNSTIADFEISGSSH